MALKILLADDSMTAQNMGKKILVDAGYDVVAVSNGAAAIKKISSERPDIAILDEYMPGYTGSEVCERVKASAETSKIPVLLTVGKMEPFDQEKANKVHADGVMIKPFEASDLIAAVQSIAQRLLAPSPAPRGLEVGTVQLRQGQSPSVDDTMRIPAPPPETISHEDTLRLTVQQIKAFQDASYHDWKNSAEHHLEEHEKAAATAAAAAEMPVTAAVEEAPAVPAMHVEEAEAPAAEAAGMILETPSASRETPVFSAMAASGVAAEHEIFNGSTAPSAPEPSAPAFYTPPVVSDADAETVPAFAVEPSMPSPEPVAPVVEAEVPAPVAEVEAEVSPVVEPVAEVAPVMAMVEPEITPEIPIVQPVIESAPTPEVADAAPVLETSAPLTPGPMPVATAAELEPTIAPPVEVAATHAPELEITSPTPERGGVIEQESALVTNTEDMSQFVTKFGVENAEPVHVGVVSDLSDEQLAAILTPVEEPISVHEEPAEEISVVSVPEPQAEEPVATASPVEEEVGILQAVEPLETVEPVLAYVPGGDDTQPMLAVEEPEPEPEPQIQAAVPPVAAEPAPVEEVAAATSVVEPEPEVVAEVARVEEPAPVQAISAEPVATEESAHEEQHAAVIQAVETAMAAAAGVAPRPGLGHIVPEEPVHEELAAPPMQHHEHFGDAALAEELAAALSTKASEEHGKALTEAVAAVQHAAASTPILGTGPQALSDTQLADAVARAFENLRPHLIAEIIKELAK